MVRQRVVETHDGIQGEFTVQAYDRLQRKMRDKGWIETKDIIKSGITNGIALEVGPGPGYLGLEWLMNTTGTSLIGLDISPDMIAVAERNAEEYGLSDRADYVQSSGDRMPFKDGSFDAVFTNGSLHEWSDPEKTFDEIRRVLKRGGRVFISDLRRDMGFFIRWFLLINTKPKYMRGGLITSLNAAYTPPELRELARGTGLESCAVSGNLIGIKLAGVIN